MICVAPSENVCGMSAMGERLKAARLKAGFSSAAKAATALGVSPSTYRAHENGQNDYGPDEAELYARRLGTSAAHLLTGRGAVDGEPLPVEIAIMGFLGAGSEIEPDYEQVPPDGLDQVTIPFPVPSDLIGFKVRGISMMPVYRDGTVILVHREQKRPLHTFFGEDAAVLTTGGRRFIKTITRGQGDKVTLTSWNADPIENQRLEWIGEIFAVLPPSALRRVERQGGIQGQLRLKSA